MHRTGLQRRALGQANFEEKRRQLGSEISDEEAERDVSQPMTLRIELIILILLVFTRFILHL